MDSLPLVSVVIPTYKRVDSLKLAIESVKNQTYKNFEIIVINDDPSTDISKILSDKGVMCLNNEEQLGGAQARNRGIKASKGKYNAFLSWSCIFLCYSP